MKKSSLIVLLLLCAAFSCANSETKQNKPTAIFTPQPNYPHSGWLHGLKGNGRFMCKLRPDGTVSAIIVLQSTGHDVLDQAAIAALNQWRFKPEGFKEVVIPVNFHSNPVRSRMGGAALDR